MRGLLTFVALLMLSACDSAKPEQTSTAIEPLNSGPSAGKSIESPVPVTQSGGDRGSGSVDYYNPSTGTTASYDLDVEYDSDGEVEQINFPSGGYIGSHHITDQEHNGDGTITITTDKGQEFTVDEEEESDTESSEDE
jgi:hypothetical protein